MATAAQETLPHSAKVARLLKMPRAAEYSDLDLAKAVEKGLPLRAVDAVAAAVAEGQKFKIVSEPTYRRAQKSNKLSPQMSGKLYDLARVAVSAYGLFRGDREKAGQFLAGPNQALEGRTPLEVALSSRAGTDAVIRMIDGARAGVAL